MKKPLKISYQSMLCNIGGQYRIHDPKDGRTCSKACGNDGKRNALVLVFDGIGRLLFVFVLNSRIVINGGVDVFMA